MLIPQEKFEISFVMLITTNVPQKVKVEILHRKLRTHFYNSVTLKFSFFNCTKISFRKFSSPVYFCCLSKLAVSVTFCHML